HGLGSCAVIISQPFDSIVLTRFSIPPSWNGQHVEGKKTVNAYGANWTPWVAHRSLTFWQEGNTGSGKRPKRNVPIVEST
ncbi:MAG: hypothetical protein M0R80_25090, partial [Proteobacteria bacterium]|nr:hypothetical protein [Pseudomonadota bacterium]